MESLKIVLLTTGGPPGGGPPSKPAAPPPMADTPWHFMDLSGNQCGPVPPEDVRAAWQSGQIDGTCIGWCETMADWQEMATITDLMEYCNF